MTKPPIPRTLVNPIEDMLGYQLRRASLVTLAALGEAFEAVGLRLTEAIILRFVEANPGCNQAEIGRALGVQRTNMVPIVGALVKAGLISRKAADGRTHALYLTENGAALTGKITALALEHENHFFGDIDAPAKAVLLRVFRSIREKAVP
jgi:DNA-binding MarR family transcriptional regulator